jgi:hypothetical protein
MIVETRTGGHLGWQESSPKKGAGLFDYTSWSDVVSGEFINATIQTQGGDWRNTVKVDIPKADLLFKSRL